MFGVGAGSYPVLFTLTDSENYRWESVNTDTLSVNFVIKKAENTWVEEPKISDTYTGLSPRIQAKALFGEVRVGYCVSELLPYSDTVPTAPGDYYAVLYVEGTEDYSSLESPPLKFSISEDRVTSLKIESYASLCEYSAFSRFSADGLVLIASYRSGREEPVSADKISISYNGKDSLRVGDRSVTLSYGGCYISHPVSVLPIEYDLSGIRFFDTEYVYDGLYHTVDSVLPNVIGLDGLPLRYAVKGGGTDSGVYGVTLAFFSDSKNYKLPEARYATVTVLPMSVLLSWSGSSFTYDGTAKLPTASYTDVLGVRRYPTVTGARCNAGEGYIAKAAADGANYVFENPECEYSIAKADYDLSGVYWSQSSFDYDGERHAVELFGLPSGVAVVGYTDASHTEAGIYTARAALEYDSENYNEPSPITHKWVIYPREYDLSGFSFSDSEAVFDGEAHYPTLFGSMPTGLDGSVLSYAFSGGAMHVDEGRVAVSVRFFTDSKNYVAPEPAVYYVTVLPRSISVTWRNGEFIYDGREKLPHATAAECAVRVTGAGVSAGFYKAYAESLDSDYRIANPEYEYEIKKAENTWQNAPTVGDIYEGDELRLKGSSLSGKACFRFFSSESPELEIAAPTRPGRYYAIAYVTESENYLGLESAPIPFEIIEVFATDFVVSLSGGTYTALSSLSAENTAAYIVYNNGERRAVDFSLLSVEYQSGSILHFGDSEVAVSYLGFRRVIPVSVVRRNYDLSEVRWQDTDTVYDGEVKCPTLIGLPDGVSVVRYEGYGSAAGEYTVRAYLSYDAENYNAPCIEDTRLTIRRRTVVPTLYAAVYDGTAHIPVSDSPLYSVINPTPQRLAGSYDVTVRLTDPENYTFGTSDEATVVFTVLPRILSLELTDRYVYLFESEAPFTVSAPEGALPADEVEILAKIEGERVIYSLNNPNYTLQKSEGRVLRLSYPSPEFTWTVLFIILFLLLIILGVLVMFYRYDDIKGAVAALRCKRKMRAVLEREKREEENNHGKPDTPTFTAEDNPGKPDTPTFTAEDNLGKPDTPTFTAEDNLGKSGTPTSAEEPFGSDAVLSFNEESCEPLAESDTVLSIDAERADELITDSLAKDLLKRPREFVLTEGKRRSVINVDTLSNSFRFGDRVDVNVLKEKKLIPYDTAYLKVLARGAIDKPLTVRANDFSLAAIKMIALTGGEAIKVVTVKEKRKR